MHWFIYQLHANKLPLRRFLKTLDGKTTGSHGESEDVGKQLEDCEKYPVRDFDAHETEMPRLSDETNDQLNCDKICF